MIKIFDNNNSTEIPWENLNVSKEERVLFSLLLQQPISKIIYNVENKLCLLQVHHFLLPVVVSEDNCSGSYVSSIYSHYVSYAFEEVNKINNTFLRFILKPLLLFLGFILKSAQINKCIYINNFNFSTNLYPNWNGEYLLELTEFCQIHFPNYTIVFRSLNEMTNANLMSGLLKQDYKLLLSRQVYLLDCSEQTYKKKADYKNDNKLLQQNDYLPVSLKDSLKEAPRIIELYNDLYLHKYSSLNPMFSTHFIEAAIQSGFFKFYGLQNSTTSQIDGIIGFYERNKIITTPICGYDTKLPQKLGLYRRLSVLLLNTCAEKQYILNLSSGAGQFKSLRGAKRFKEFSAIYYQHLPFTRKLGWYCLEVLIKPMEYFMDKFDF